MKSLSSIDVHYIVKELKGLQGSRVDNIYQKEKEEILLQLHRSGEGKKSGKRVFLTLMEQDVDRWHLI